MSGHFLGVRLLSTEVMRLCFVSSKHCWSSNSNDVTHSNEFNIGLNLQPNRTIQPGLGFSMRTRKEDWAAAEPPNTVRSWTLLYGFKMGWLQQWIFMEAYLWPNQNCTHKSIAPVTLWLIFIFYESRRHKLYDVAPVCVRALSFVCLRNSMLRDSWKKKQFLTYC